MLQWHGWHWLWRLLVYQLGNWTWANEVPWTGLTAWNPPLLVGAFYCLGDLLVNMTVVRFEEKATVGVVE